MRNVIIKVTDSRTGNSASLTTYPYRPNKPKHRYRVPLYRIEIEGKNQNNTNVTETFEAIRFGIYRSKTRDPRVVGLKDSQRHTLSWDNITTMLKFN